MHHKKWTDEDINFLTDNWGHLSLKTIAKNLDRTENAINIKKDRFKLGAFLNNGDYITWNQLAIALGRKSFEKHMLTSWIKKRDFPVKTKTVGKCKFRIVYLSDFWKWAEKNRTFINFSRVEVNILGKEPNWVKEQRKADQIKKSKVICTPWTNEEDIYLHNLLKSFRYNIIELSKMLHRTEGAIQRRISFLGFKERPIKADNHIKWTEEEYFLLGEMIKKGTSYEEMSERLGKSAKVIRGRVFEMYLTERLDKVIGLISDGVWGNGRPEKPAKIST